MMRGYDRYYVVTVFVKTTLKKLRSIKEHIFGIQHIDKLLTGMQSNIGKGHEAQGNSRQEQMMQFIP